MCSIESNHIWNLGTWNLPFSVISNLRPILLIFWLPKMTIAINRPYFLERNQSGQKRMRICIRFTENTKKTVSKTLWKWRKCARFEALCPPPPLWSKGTASTVSNKHLFYSVRTPNIATCKCQAISSLTILPSLSQDNHKITFFFVIIIIFIVFIILIIIIHNVWT